MELTARLDSPSLVLINHAITFSTALLVAYLLFSATLFTSIVVYRLSSFHPLAKYPGPVMCKIFQLWTVLTYSRGKAHHYRKLLHDRYGPIVCIGPNELSVTDKDMLPYILGSQGMPKGPMFEGRRMAPDYEELMLLRAHQLLNTLETICKEQGGVACVDIATWIGYFVFDFTGDMAFGGGFGLMRDGDNERLLRKMSKSLYYACLCQAVPWFSPVLRNLPYFGEPMRTFGSFSFQRVKKRYNQKPDRKDLFYHLTATYHADSQESSFPLIVSNSLLVIVAGADTTATVLRNAIFYLLTNPTYYTHLREEIDATFPPTETSSLGTEVLSGLPFLNAVINEVLRLQPPISTTLQRAPAKGTGGKQMGTQYDLAKFYSFRALRLAQLHQRGYPYPSSPYVLHRDPRYFFPRPDEFWPDRWIVEAPDSQEFVLDRSAFIPFSMGPANCVGKSLAMLELRTIVSLFVMHFVMEFGDSFDPKTWTNSLKDYFVLESGKLIVKPRMRRRQSE